MPFLFWTFTLLIMLAPLPFGMVHGLSQALFACLVLAAAAGYCLALLRAGRSPAVPLRWIWPETAAFALVMVWVAVQMLAVVPQAWQHPFWAEAGEVLGLELAGSISLTRGSGFAGLMRLATYAAVFWLALQWGRDRRRAGQLVAAVVLAATLYAVYGLVVHFTDLRSVLWVEKTSYVQDLTGTFVNRNSFATYLGMALLAVTGFYLAGFFRVLQSGRRGRDRLLHVLQQALVRAAPQLACLLILLTALLLTHSRAGVTLSLAVLLVMALLFGPLRRAARTGFRLTIGTMACAAAAALLLSGDGYLARLTATDLDREQRLHVYAQTWQAIGNAPCTGYGLGGFAQVFPLYAEPGVSNYDKAHNDWLETVFELGWPAALVWFAILAGLALRCLLGFFQRRRDHVYPLLGFCASLLVGLHALVDFSLQIPGVAVTFAALLGVGAAQSWSSTDR